MYSAIDRLARWFALLGGVALSILILLTCASIAGRSLNSFLHGDWAQSTFPVLAASLLDLGIGPINGDFELVEAGMAFTIFAFLPLCHLHGAHASVGIFTSSLPPKAMRFLRVVIDSVFALVMILLAVQLFNGMESKRSSGQVTFLLEFPLWWAYALSLSGAMVAALVACFVAAVRVIELFTGRYVLPERVGADR